MRRTSGRVNERTARRGAHLPRAILVLASDPGQRLVAADLVAQTSETPWQTLMLAVDFKGATVIRTDV